MKKVFLIILISFILFGCTSNSLKLNDEITLKGRVVQEEMIENGTYQKINVLSLEDPIIIDGTQINKIEIDTEKDYNNEVVELTGVLSNNTISGLSYSLKDIK